VHLVFPKVSASKHRRCETHWAGAGHRGSRRLRSLGAGLSATRTARAARRCNVQCYPTEGKHGQATSLLAFEFFWFSDLIPTWREETRKGLESPWEHPELPLCPFWGWTTASCDLCRRASQVGHLWSDKRVRCCAARIQFYCFAMLFPLTLTAISHYSIVYSHRDFRIK